VGICPGVERKEKTTNVRRKKKTNQHTKFKKVGSSCDHKPVPPPVQKLQSGEGKEKNSRGKGGEVKGRRRGLNTKNPSIGREVRKGGWNGVQKERKEPEKGRRPEQIHVVLGRTQKAQKEVSL